MGETAENVADPRRLARGAGRVRGPQPQARRGGVGGRALRRLGRPARRGCGARARRGDPARHEHREARGAQARVREGRDGHRGQRVAAQRRRGRAADRRRGGGRGDRARAAGPDRRPRHVGVDPDVFGIGPSKQPSARCAAPGSAGTTWSRRAQRGVRLAVARLLARARSWTRRAQRQRRRDRDRPPARRSGVRLVATSGTSSAAGGALRSRDVCIGVGQGQAALFVRETVV